MVIDEKNLAKIMNIRLYFEAPSDWTTREYIEIIDEYLMERLPVILNNALEPYGLEASIMENMTECDLGIEPCNENTFIVYVYESGSNKPLYKVVFYHRIGENTYELYLMKILK